MSSRLIIEAADVIIDEGLTDKIKKLSSSIWEGLKFIGEKISGFFKWAYKKIKGLVVSAFNNSKDAASKMVKEKQDIETKEQLKKAIDDMHNKKIEVPKILTNLSQYTDIVTTFGKDVEAMKTALIDINKELDLLYGELCVTYTDPNKVERVTSRMSSISNKYNDYVNKYGKREPMSNVKDDTITLDLVDIYNLYNDAYVVIMKSDETIMTEITSSQNHIAKAIDVMSDKIKTLDEKMAKFDKSDEIKKVISEFVSIYGKGFISYMISLIKEMSDVINLHTALISSLSMGSVKIIEIVIDRNCGCTGGIQYDKSTGKFNPSKI